MTHKAEPAKGITTRWIVLVAGIIAFAVLWGVWDWWNRHQRPLDCGDGQRYAIDTRQFDTRYFAYSLQLEATVNEKSKVSLKLDPVQMEKLSQALQSANEFRKYIVSGFNSCAITRAQYGQFGARFQALDSLAREINELVSHPARSAQENSKLALLVNEYADLARKLGTD